MNHVNWVQQEDNTRYHVLKWRTSHFHETPGGLSSAAAVQSSAGGAGSSAPTVLNQTDGIGLGILDTRQGSYRSGGTGTDGLAENGSKYAPVNDAVSISTSGAQRQQAAVTGVEAPLADIKITDDVKSTLNTAAQPAQAPEKAVRPGAEEEALKPADILSGMGKGDVRGRLKDTAQRMKEFCLKQLEKQKRAKAVLTRSESEEEKGTRKVNRESMLAMQAENHYLLDSYDKNGQYSMLGK